MRPTEVQYDAVQPLKGSTMQCSPADSVVSRAELEAVAAKFPGFLRLALSEPDPARQFHR